MTPSYVLEYENITPIFEVSDSESPKRSNKSYSPKESIITNKIMTQEDFLNTDWKHHDIVKLTNGKEYVVQKHKKRYILLLIAHTLLLTTISLWTEPMSHTMQPMRKHLKPTYSPQVTVF